MGMLVLYWVIMFVTYFSASKLRLYRDKLTFLPHITMGIVYVIVLLMGLGMGANKEVINNLGSIGIRAFIITVFCVAGSMMAVFIVRKIMGMNRFGDLNNTHNKEFESGTHGEKADNKSHNLRGLKSTLTILGLVTVGSIIGIVVIQRQPNNILKEFDRVNSSMMTVLLCIMVAFVGFDLGLSGKVAECLKVIGIRAFVFPIAAIVGSLAMGAISGCWLGFSIRESLAISAGFGWYTYAPAVIASAGAEYAVASAVAFMYNMIRETASIVLLPVFAKHFGYLEVIAMPGISSMDICLPIIESSCRQDTVVYAFLTGFYYEYSHIGRCTVYYGHVIYRELPV